MADQSLNPWGHLPYSYENGSAFAQGQPTPGGSTAGGGTGFSSMIGPAISSMFAPNQSQGQQQPAPAPPPQQPPPQYVFGGDNADNTADENRANADRIGQGVLAASQAAAAQVGQKKKKLGQPGGQQGGLGGDSGGGDYSGSAGMGGF